MRQRHTTQVNVLNHLTKKHENDPDPIQPGDLVRLTGLNWIGHDLMGKMGIVLTVSNDLYVRSNICVTLFVTRIAKVLEDDLTLESRAHQNEHGTM